jgi:aryl-alcohol dehydrogenase-like predicted oxidoreductase
VNIGLVEEGSLEYRSLGKSGLKVSALCLGTMQFGWTADKRASFAVLSRAYEEGINFIDTADVYSRWAEGNPGGVAESIVGEWMRKESIPRNSVVLATKVRGRMGEGPNDEGLSRKHILDSIEGSLERLGTDYVDLYQFHHPDEGTPMGESLDALADLKRSGEVHYVGCSNYKAWELMQALWVADRYDYPFMVSLQPHYNLVHREEYERELEEVCRRYGLGVIPYSPLAGGFLTGKYDPDEPIPEGSRGTSSSRIRRYMKDETSLEVVRAVTDVAQRMKVAPSQVALRWLLQRPNITSPIIGPKSVEQLVDNLGALSLELTAEQLERVQAATDHR